MQNDDPLAGLKSLRAETSVTAAAGKEPYVAFKAVNRRVIRLHVKSATPAGKHRLGERLSYSHLLRIIDDDLANEMLALVYHFAVVIIRGRHLYAVAEAIDREQCEWIQPFIAERHERPIDPDAPFIATIDIRVERDQMMKLLGEFMDGAAGRR